jgi:hypothetical protein
MQHSSRISKARLGQPGQLFDESRSTAIISFPMDPRSATPRQGSREFVSKVPQPTNDQLYSCLRGRGNDERGTKLDWCRRMVIRDRDMANRTPYHFHGAHEKYPYIHIIDLASQASCRLHRDVGISQGKRNAAMLSSGSPSTQVHLRIV